jgi:hypothetical protein
LWARLNTSWSGLARDREFLLPIFVDCAAWARDDVARRRAGRNGVGGDAHWVGLVGEMWFALRERARTSLRKAVEFYRTEVGTDDGGSAARRTLQRPGAVLLRLPFDRRRVAASRLPPITAQPSAKSPSVAGSGTGSS